MVFCLSISSIADAPAKWLVFSFFFNCLKKKEKKRKELLTDTPLYRENIIVIMRVQHPLTPFNTFFFSNFQQLATTFDCKASDQQLPDTPHFTKAAAYLEKILDHREQTSWNYTSIHRTGYNWKENDASFL